MICRNIDLGNGKFAIVCGPRGKSHFCKVCGQPSSKQCDFPVVKFGKAGSCDVHLCKSCAVTQPETQTINGQPDTVDYCPLHDRNKDKIFEQRERGGLDRNGLPNPTPTLF